MVISNKFNTEKIWEVFSVTNTPYKKAGSEELSKKGFWLISISNE